jgi:hypothetical protein
MLPVKIEARFFGGIFDGKPFIFMVAEVGVEPTRSLRFARF